MKVGSIEQWKAEGAMDARRLLAEYEEPKLDEAKDEELRAYIDRRSREIPAVDALNEDH
ncbi:trimethylamine methyltransferase family protein [Mesorhizobium waimense]|uniref:trimethylamine methyltransferase family protein n=1 Tax=Mesorhizobium waimense TaxID=1300307 RepID=UPI001FE1B38D|nr:trimethylamine methyltransferase family protein [Mesorhizobium waimense]